MGKFTRLGSSALDALIESDLSRITDCVTRAPFTNDIISLILNGGYGRGDGTPFRKEGKEVPFNDYDCIVVASNCSQKQLKRLREHLIDCEKELARELDIPVDLYLHTPNSLKKAENSLFNCELKQRFYCFYGSPAPLNFLPACDPRALPHMEALRLLLNRGTLLLLAQTSLDKEQRAKFLMKADLAQGDALLILNNAYTIWNAEKLVQLNALKNTPPNFQNIQLAYEKALACKELGTLYPYLNSQDALIDAYGKAIIELIYWGASQILTTRITSPESLIEGFLAKTWHTSPVTIFANTLRSLKHFKFGAFSPSAIYVTLHPRIRLLAALPLLLKHISSPFLEELVGTPPLQCYFAIWKHLS